MPIFVMAGGVMPKFRKFCNFDEDMRPFIHENFLLSNKTAIKLFHEYSENQPIVDFHCHLSPALLAADTKFANLTDAWITGDHYKWRAMRTNGIAEKYCTGDSPSKEKFEKWALTVPFTIGNPLYHWTHLELKRYFNIGKLLSPSTAGLIYDQASEMLQDESFSTRSILKKMNVIICCTTDDPADDLEAHKKLRDTFNIKVLPAFRPDNILKTDDPHAFCGYLNRIEKSAAVTIRNFDDLIEALERRHSFFHGMGTRLSDHGLDRFWFSASSPAEINSIFRKLTEHKKITIPETEKFRTAILLELCRMNHKRGWTQQFHVGALRNNNSRAFTVMGSDTGWDSIGSVQNPVPMSLFLNELDKEDRLAKTILYNLNPADNEMMITMAGNFNDGSVPGKLQFGPAWWFLDQKTGIEKHFRDLSSFGLLSRFIGMVTDSRSFLSYPRHEYFRRLLCNFIGEEVENGFIPDEEELVRPLIEGISYKNAIEYLNL